VELPPVLVSSVAVWKTEGLLQFKTCRNCNKLRVELNEKSEADDLKLLHQSGLLSEDGWKALGGTDLYTTRLGKTNDCLTVEDLDLYLGAKGRILREEPEHLQRCEDCRRAFELYRQIRAVDFQRYVS